MTENHSHLLVRPVARPVVRHDVVVVGGGPTGLSAATTLARSLRSVAVVDAGEPSDAPAPAAHDLLGREGTPLLELLATGRHEAEAHGAVVVGDRAVAARRTATGFEVDLAGGGTLRGRRLLLATGLVDELPDVPGVREHWGAGVLHRPSSHGDEVRGQRIGILGTGPRSVHQALLFRQLSDRVTVFLHTLDDLDDEVWEQFAALGIGVVTGTVDRLRGEDGAVTAVVLADGHEFAVDAVVVAPVSTARGDLFEQLGGHLDEHPGGTRLATDDRGATAVDGVWAAGNATDPSAPVSVAAGAGVLVALRLHADLVTEDVRAAVRTHRAPTVREVFSAASEARVSALALGDRAHGLAPAAVPRGAGPGVTAPRRP